jgi:hypothetical protein
MRTLKSTMKVLQLTIWLCVGTLPAFADSTVDSLLCRVTTCDHRAAPAPLIGLSIPAALAVGGALLGAKFLKRRR